jgi:hypothetical protein
MEVIPDHTRQRDPSIMKNRHHVMALVVLFFPSFGTP